MPVTIRRETLYFVLGKNVFSFLWKFCLSFANSFTSKYCGRFNIRRHFAGNAVVSWFWMCYNSLSMKIKPKKITSLISSESWTLFSRNFLQFQMNAMDTISPINWLLNNEPEEKNVRDCIFAWACGNVVIIGVFVVVIENQIIECFCCQCIACICVGFAGKLFICHKNWRHIL